MAESMHSLLRIAAVPAALALCWFAAEAMPAAVPPAAAQPAAAKASPVKVVDLNRASLAELKTVPGIGDAEAARIVAGRPWLTKSELATRHVVPTGVYLSLRRHVVARPDASSLARAAQRKP